MELIHVCIYITETETMMGLTAIFAVSLLLVWAAEAKSADLLQPMANVIVQSLQTNLKIFLYFSMNEMFQSVDNLAK